MRPPSGVRLHALCPSCGSLERHRLQYLVLEDLARTVRFRDLRVLHVAPEPFFERWFRKRCGRYETADLQMRGVDHRADLTSLSFADATYDLVYASHVLEHIREDRRALSEIRRVLSPGGLTILPVPRVAERTVEYPAPNPHESHHVRAPGPDYFDRYRQYFDDVVLHRSGDFDERFQVFVYEDRTSWPTTLMPHRPPMAGTRHEDIVPVSRA